MNSETNRYLVQLVEDLDARVTPYAIVDTHDESVELRHALESLHPATRVDVVDLHALVCESDND